LLLHRRLGFSSLAQHDAITHEPDPAVHVAATFGIIDAIAVADIETALAGSIARSRAARNNGQAKKNHFEYLGLKGG
jgi:hypothetical protein